MTSKRRARLKAIASTIDPIIYVGKEGVIDGTIQLVDEALLARQLIKGSVQQNSDVTAKEACDILASATGAEVIMAMGRKFVLYRRNSDLPEIE